MKTIIHSIKFLLISALCLTISACSKPQASIVVAGSTSVQPYMEILAEEFMIFHYDDEIYVQGGGSSAGITAAENETADIGMSSRNLTDEESFLWSVEIAKDGLALIVNPKNPISDLSIEQLCDIYSGKTTNWSDVGGISSTKDRIHIITREEGSGTRSAFESLVMGKVEITAKAIVQDSNGAVRQLVSDDPNAIGFISLGLVDDTVKALSIGGIKATKENIINESYTLYRPFLLVAASEPKDEVKTFIDWILSTAGQKLLTNEGLIAPKEDDDGQ